jgi:hypothetical protein
VQILAPLNMNAQNALSQELTPYGKTACTR